MYMDWSAVAIFVAVVFLFVLFKRAGQIAAKDAQTHLQNGALIIDVRTTGEFSAGHLPKAINLPLDGIETSLPRRVKNKDQVLLLHCQSGIRSGMAKGKLKALGYANAFNLGSYGRAERIVNSR
ncbi:MAG: rhodanese-like domain-containing protein [Acidobacteriota bacterium]